MYLLPLYGIAVYCRAGDVLTQRSVCLCYSCPCAELVSTARQ